MNENLVETLTAQAKTVYEPMGKINALMIANMEKLAEFQLDAVKSYAELAMQQWKQVASVRDIESLKEFGASQSEMAGELGKKIVEDMKSLGELGMGFKSEVEDILSDAREPNKEAKDEAIVESEETATNA